GGEPIGGLARDPHRDGLLAPLISKALDRIPKRLPGHGIELDAGDADPAAAELDAARPGLAQLDPGALQGEQVLDRLGRRAEPVVQLVADRAQLAAASGRGDAAV